MDIAIDHFQYKIAGLRSMLLLQNLGWQKYDLARNDITEHYKQQIGREIAEYERVIAIRERRHVQCGKPQGQETRRH